MNGAQPHIRNVLDSANVTELPSRATISPDLFEQQQKMLLEAQRDFLKLQQEAAAAVVAGHLLVAQQSVEMLKMIQAAAADVAARATHAPTPKPEGGGAHDILSQVYDFLKEKGLIQS